jgi:hypothetical protein
MEQKLGKQRYQMGGVLSRIIIVDRARYHYPPLKNVQYDFVRQRMVVLGSIATTDGRRAGGREPTNEQVMLSGDGSLPPISTHRANIVVTLPRKAERVRGALEDACQIRKCLLRTTPEVVAHHHHRGGGGRRRGRRTSHEAVATRNVDEYHRLEEVDDDPRIGEDNRRRI